MLENGVTIKETPKDCLLRQLEGSYSNLGIAILSNGSKVITRNGCEVLSPEGKREEIVEKLHMQERTQCSDSARENYSGRG